MASDQVAEVRRLLRDQADEKTAESSQRFFKEPVAAYGVKSAAVKKIAAGVFAALKKRPKAEILALCEELWSSGYMEEAGVACEWAYTLREQYEPDDFAVFERWLEKYVSNWAFCDNLCNHTIAAAVERYPQMVPAVKAWVGSANRWKRRAAAVTFIVPARKGLWLDDLLAIADQLLLDRDDMVQKAYGWLLKAASEAHPEKVYEYVLSKRDLMPRTAFHYSLEKMPRAWRDRAMSK